jgi:hypothetical protein
VILEIINRSQEERLMAFGAEENFQSMPSSLSSQAHHNVDGEKVENIHFTGPRFMSEQLLFAGSSNISRNIDDVESMII